MDVRVEAKWGRCMGIEWIEWGGRWAVHRRMGEKTVGRVDGGCVGQYLESHLAQGRGVWALKPDVLGCILALVFPGQGHIHPSP